MRYSRYVESICPKDIMIAVYNENVEAKLLIDDIIYEDWNDIGFDRSDSKDWEVCPAFASEKDFNNWWYGR